MDAPDELVEAMLSWRTGMHRTGCEQLARAVLAVPEIRDALEAKRKLAEFKCRADYLFASSTPDSDPEQSKFTHDVMLWITGWGEA